MIDTGDTALVLISAALVCLMTPGLAFFYGGLVNRKNVLTIMMQSFISMGVVTAIWFLVGFSLAFGTDINGIIGGFQHIFLNGVGLEPSAVYGGTIPFVAFYTYQQMFAIITPALITGAFADRVNFKGYLVFLVIWSLLVYIPFTHWIWGGGFLQQLGVIDFAGGIVVHVSAGMAALASIIFIGKRQNLDKLDRTPHNITYVALGAALLWFGWFGFNGGSALHANGIAAAAFVNTDIAGSVAMLTWLIISWYKEKRPSFVGALTGAVAGLATITPAAGYVEPWAAFLIGIASGAVCYMAVQIRTVKKWDDALDVWGVHGVGGILGSILVGVFAVEKIGGVNGLIGGNPKLLLVQTLAVLFTAAYAFIVTYLILVVVNRFVKIRVSPEEELQGLDYSIHKEDAYRI
ncbi:MAG: ammonium transporter Amt family [Fusobacteria bacterium]|nr:MAG: ammonium transporter Amt family [Fusobacteriota bacterium]KAF0230224.1 MAG: ammonium transporter Amt [Fusobacteriota bacterium]